MPKDTIHLNDIINIGEPPNTEQYLVTSEPDDGRYCTVCHIGTSATHTVYLGRWATLANPAVDEMHPFD